MTEYRPVADGEARCEDCGRRFSFWKMDKNLMDKCVTVWCYCDCGRLMAWYPPQGAPEPVEYVDIHVSTGDTGSEEADH